jgi:hypothetical protein
LGPVPLRRSTLGGAASLPFAPRTAARCCAVSPLPESKAPNRPRVVTAKHPTSRANPGKGRPQLGWGRLTPTSAQPLLRPDPTYLSVNGPAWRARDASSCARAHAQPPPSPAPISTRPPSLPRARASAPPRSQRYGTTADARTGLHDRSARATHADYGERRPVPPRQRRIHACEVMHARARGKTRVP